MFIKVVKTESRRWQFLEYDGEGRFVRYPFKGVMDRRTALMEITAFKQRGIKVDDADFLANRGPKKTPAPLILAQLNVSNANAVILNGQMIYTEDDDKGYSNGAWTAEAVIRKLSKALNIPYVTVAIDVDDDTAGRGEWTFDDVLEAALNK